MAERHLLIVAHGSRRQASNDEVRELGERLRAMRDPGIDRVEVAFLELAEPSIPDRLARCAAEGAGEIIVFPYFLAAGSHVAHDIPEALAAFSQAHPDVQVRLTPHLGASSALAYTVMDVARSASQ